MSDIPSRDFGKLEATVEQLELRLEKTVAHLEARIDNLTRSVETLTTVLNRAEGGWKVLAGVSATTAAVTALVLKFAGLLKGL